LQTTSGGQKTDFADFWHFHEKISGKNKKLVASEEELIKTIIKKQPVEYFASSKGYWYSYETMNELDTLTPKGIVFFDYEIKDIKGNIIAITRTKTARPIMSTNKT
jgi:hypothetical protein